jgi:hypothetical protein
MLEMIIEVTANPLETGTGREGTFLSNTEVTQEFRFPAIRFPRESRQFWANSRPLFHRCDRVNVHHREKITDSPKFEAGGVFKLGRATQSEEVIS